jgi:flagellar biosynthetic protein FlhB
LAEEFQERSELATSKRRREFRERGEVAMTPDGATACVFLVAGAALAWLGPGVASVAASFMGDGLRMVEAGAAPAGDTLAATAAVAARAAGGLAVVCLAVMVVAATPSFVQTGFNFTLKPLSPDLDRINPFKRFTSVFFSIDALANLLREGLKLAAVGVAAYWALRDCAENMPSLAGASAGQILTLAGERSGRLFLSCGAAMAVVAVLDFLWRWQRLERKMRMTRDELKRERREEEGEPLLRMRMRARWREMSLNRLLREVPRADVVVVNPTHYAVALRYAPSEAKAPRVTAKGKDHVALRIREIARGHGVPIVEEPPLARAIYSGVRVGKEVPVALYKAVARVLAHVYSLRRARGGGTR